MEPQSAMQIVENALNVACQKGAFSLQDAATVYAAMTVVQSNINQIGMAKIPEPQPPYAQQD